jgi:DNA-directed RNA polymerase subunit RPC12/RpoP
LRPAQLPGRFVCVYCLRRFELVSQCPNCGEHQTISRMSRTEDMRCQHCGHSMLRSI